MTTEGTALAGLLQQEREALEREQAVAKENGSADPITEVEASLNGDPEKTNAEICDATGSGGAQSAQPHMRDTIAA